MRATMILPVILLLVGSASCLLLRQAGRGVPAAVSPGPAASAPAEAVATEQTPA